MHISDTPGDVSDAAIPQLSVILPCRDAAGVLTTQLRALAGQQCPVAWELLLCDNGSRDGTRQLAAAWQDRLPLRVLDASAATGAGATRNIGIAAACGEWVAFCDADDEVDADWLSELCHALQRDSFIAGRCDGRRLNSARTLRSRRPYQNEYLQECEGGPGLPFASACNLAAHRRVLREAGGFDPALRHLEDTDLCWRVQRNGHALVFAPRVLVHVRLRSTLPAMYRQGRDYGIGQAGLEARYPQPRTAAATPGRRHALLGALRLARYFVSNRSSAGEQAWQLGWHLGHRSAARHDPGTGPAALPVAASRGAG